MLSTSRFFNDENTKENISWYMLYYTNTLIYMLLNVMKTYMCVSKMPRTQPCAWKTTVFNQAFEVKKRIARTVIHTNSKTNVIQPKRLGKGSLWDRYKSYKIFYMYDNDKYIYVYSCVFVYLCAWKHIYVYTMLNCEKCS